VAADAGTATAAETLAGEDAANVVRVKKRVAKGKAKAREPREESVGEAKPLVKKEENDETEWHNGMRPSNLKFCHDTNFIFLYYLVVGREAGPSSGQIRRP
jgi:hypothetical protein